MITNEAQTILDCKIVKVLLVNKLLFRIIHGLLIQKKRFVYWKRTRRRTTKELDMQLKLTRASYGGNNE